MRMSPGELRKRWHLLCPLMGEPPTRSEVYDELIAAYTDKSRHYHSLDHITECLREFDAVREQADDADAVETAIWFHDVVYDGQRHDNEVKSAAFADAALQKLGAPPSFRQKVGELILLTRHDREPDTQDGRLIVDIDLSSLALPPADFDRNTDLIRREYPHVSEDQFRRGRCELLKRFLKRPRIYFTNTFFNRSEQSARQNLERALARLCKGHAG
jgi:predicted metal-dependent HD superfamily phosphohydrolase